MSGGDKRTTMIRLEHIHIDRKLQARVTMDEEACADYGTRYKNGDYMPPIQVCEEGKNKYWLWDGFHRVDGCLREKIKMIYAEIRPGTRRDALWLAIGANQGHGVKRSREDMRKAVELLLADEQWKKLSASEIARHCGVSAPFIRNVRDEYEARILKHLRIEEAAAQEVTQTVTRNGTTYEQKKPPGPAPAAAAPAPARPMISFGDAPPLQAKREPEYETFMWLPPKIERCIETVALWLHKCGADGEAPLADLRRLCAIEKKRVKR